MRDLAGQKFNKLTPQFYMGGGCWECKCECGENVIIESYNITSGRTKSCGCLRKANMQKIAKIGRKRKTQLSQDGNYRYYKDNPHYDYKK